MRHIISVLVENHFGVLTRIAGMFSSRGFNIDCLSVGETADPTVSRMTIITNGDQAICEQIVKQLRKLVDVIRVQDITREENVERELMLVKVACTRENRAEIMQMASILRAHIVDVGPESLVIEVVGDFAKLDAMLEILKPYGILENARTGVVGLARGAQSLKV
jgi:acetolactate synthase I/III small subunit